MDEENRGQCDLRSETRPLGFLTLMPLWKVAGSGYLLTLSMETPCFVLPVFSELHGRV